MTNLIKKPQLHPRWIDKNALKIVEKLQEKKHPTYLVGGCVRDLLIGLNPKDYDIVTMAKPEEIRRIIKYAYVIGKRFRLVLVKRYEQQYEVATFRSLITPEQFEETGDNVYGSPEEDATRRDFTINGLFYDPCKEKIIDFIGGMKDIEDRTMRMIGDPTERINEDPIRTLRALRLTHKINFRLEPALKKAMQETAPILQTAVLPRKREELLKILRLKNPANALYEAMDLNILQNFVPSLVPLLSDSEKAEVFFHYLYQAMSRSFDKADPTVMFGIFLFSYLQATDSRFPNSFNAKEYFEDESELKTMLKDEVGMFRVEQESFCQALNLLKQLQADPKKQHKDTYVNHVVKNNGFPLCMHLAKSHYLLPPDLIEFWWSKYLKLNN